MRFNCPHCSELIGKRVTPSPDNPDASGVMVGAIGICEKCSGLFEVVSLEGDGAVKSVTREEVAANDPTATERIDALVGRTSYGAVVQKLIVLIDSWVQVQWRTRPNVVVPLRLDFRELPVVVDPASGRRGRTMVQALVSEVGDAFAANLMARELVRYVATKLPDATWLMFYAVLKEGMFDEQFLRVVWKEPLPIGRLGHSLTVLHPGKGRLS